MLYEALAVLTVLGFPVAIVSFVLAILRLPAIRHLEEVAARTINRSRFGKVRTDLMSLAREGEVDVRSELFGILYGSLTILMRNPYDYSKASRMIIAAMSSPTATVAQRDSDARVLGPVALDFARALDKMCCDFFWGYRWAVRLNPKSEVPLFVRIHARGRRARQVADVITAGQKLRAVAVQQAAA